MGFLDRFRRTEDHPSARTHVEETENALTSIAPEMSTPPPTPASSAKPTQKASATLYTGNDTLEVVGESNYQDALWRIVGGQRGEVSHPVIAVLVPEPTNPYDPNAINVQIEGSIVGYLSRSDAIAYGPGLRSLMSSTGTYVALEGLAVSVNGGIIGVFLDHDPADFGMTSTRASRSAPPVWGGETRTGFSEAWLADADDDDYDLSWFNDLPDGDRAAIARLRDLIASDPDPVDRHFQFAELEGRLYRCRDLYETALNEYDEACRLHDAEIDRICAVFKSKWGKVPLLDTYRQMAIRQQKLKDWAAVVWWCERGLALYGNDAAREEAVEDLTKRRNRAKAKLEPSPMNKSQLAPRTAFDAPVGPPTDLPPPVTGDTSGEVEVLVCESCGVSFERVRVRGRKPRLCPECRRSA